MTNEQLQAAIDRYSAAAQGNTADLHAAVGDLLEAFATRGQQLVVQTCALMLERLDRIE